MVEWLPQAVIRIVVLQRYHIHERTICLRLERVSFFALRCMLRRRRCWSPWGLEKNRIAFYNNRGKKKIDLYVIRITQPIQNKNSKKVQEKETHYHNARPCIYCLALLKLFGVRRVFYSTDSSISTKLNFSMEKISTMVSTQISFACQKTLIRNNKNVIIKRKKH